MGYAARLAYPTHRPRTFLSPGYQGTLGWGYATSLGVKVAKPDTPVVSINGDGGFLVHGDGNGNGCATRNRCRRRGVQRRRLRQMRKRIQQLSYNNRTIASDLRNPIS